MLNENKSNMVMLASYNQLINVPGEVSVLLYLIIYQLVGWTCVENNIFPMFFFVESFLKTVLFNYFRACIFIFIIESVYQLVFF